VHGVKAGVGLLGVIDEVLVVGLFLASAVFAIVTHVDVNLWHLDVGAFIAGVKVELVALFV
jgi:hypothetical protein